MNRCLSTTSFCLPLLRLNFDVNLSLRRIKHIGKDFSKYIKSHARKGYDKKDDPIY